MKSATLQAALLAALALSSAACYELRALRAKIAPSTTVKFIASSGDRGPVAPEQVTVYRLGDGRLPPGFTANSRGGVTLEGGYPTEESPSAILGDVWVEGDSGASLTNEALTAQAVAEAARHGASAVVVPDCNLSPPRCKVAAIWISSARPETNFPSAEKLLGAAKPPSGAKPGAVRVDVIGNLSKDTVTIDARRGTCYAINLALDKDAMLSGEARKELSIVVRFDGKMMIDTGLDAEISRSKRTFTSMIGCPQTDGPMDITLVAAMNVDTGRTGALGTGPFVVAAYTWPISEDQLDRNKAAREADVERSAISRKKSCDACRKERNTCLDDGGLGCITQYKECIERKGMWLKDCDR